MTLDRTSNITPHFKWRELIRDCDPDPSQEVINNLSRLAHALEYLRQDFFDNRAIHINSGFRTPEHNKEVGGAPNSQHLIGKAADITVDGLTPRQVQELLKDWPGGLGSYSTWTHVDIREMRARWEGA